MGIQLKSITLMWFKGPTVRQIGKTNCKEISLTGHDKCQIL